jgi:protein TonB
MAAHESQPEPRAAYRPPAGMPLEDPGKWGLPVSLLLHVLMVLLLLVPAMATGVIPSPLATGAGGPGAVGGGGGGTNGRGVKGIRPERLRFLHVAPAVVAVPTPAEEKPVPPPITPPVEQPKPTPAPEPVTSSSIETSTVTVADAEGEGGTGNDGSSGNGPGRGGGVGSGEGTGRGSGAGPGAGGGNSTVYEPSPTQLLLPPIPVPKELTGTAVVAFFDVDSTGRVLSVEFNPTRNRSYNSKLRDRLNETRFRPAVRDDGTPIRARTSITIQL